MTQQRPRDRSPQGGRSRGASGPGPDGGGDGRSPTEHDTSRHGTPQRDTSELPAEQLDDERDRDELRQRYYGLLQEMRVVLPGVQVLVAFLLTAPFASGFARLDDVGRAAFAVATASSLVAVACLVTPAVLHRIGDRTRRSRRLAWGIRLSQVGIVGLGVALLSALWCVSRYVYGDVWGALLTAPIVAVYLGLWVVLPRRVGR